MCLAYFSHAIHGCYTTRHWQTSGRLVHEFNACTVGRLSNAQITSHQGSNPEVGRIPFFLQSPHYSVACLHEYLRIPMYAAVQFIQVLSIWRSGGIEIMSKANR